MTYEQVTTMRRALERFEDVLEHVKEMETHLQSITKKAHELSNSEDLPKEVLDKVRSIGIASYYLNEELKGNLLGEISQ